MSNRTDRNRVRQTPRSAAWSWLLIVALLGMASCSPAAAAPGESASETPFVSTFTTDTPLPDVFATDTVSPDNLATDTPFVGALLTDTPFPAIIGADTPTPVAASASSSQAITATVAAPANWWEVDFTNPISLKTSDELQFDLQIPAAYYQGSITEKLIQHIDAAQSSIHIASFETDLTDVANALVRAKGRGVDVRWITDDVYGIQADTKPGRGQFKLLKDAGIQVIDDERSPLMHDKFWVFDGQTVWTGSTNVTVSGMFEQNNNAIIIQSSELATIYEREFEEMWQGYFNAQSPSTVDQQALTIDGTAIQVLFSPEDQAITHILPYVQAAQSSIEFLAFTYTQRQLGQAMIERKNAGVDVRGVFETTGSTDAFSQMPPLFCAQTPVRQDGNPAFMHHKVIIIDGHIVITGSLNFTDNADKQNSENVIILDNADIARLYMQEFQRVWDAGHDPDPAKVKC